LSDAAVLDDLGVVLDCLAKTLKKSAHLGPLAQLGPAHAAARFAQHFSLEQVSGEYVYFRRALYRELENSYCPLSRSESEALQSMMDVIGAGATASFTKQRETRMMFEAEALADFLASLSHDVQNDISGILLAMKSLERWETELGDLFPDEQQAARFSAFLSDIRLCRTAITSTLTATSRILEAERLRQPLDAVFREIDLQLLLNGLVRSSERWAKERSASHPELPTIRVHLQCLDGLRVETDPDLLATILGNLLQNAVKYSRSEIWLAARKFNTKWTISICDDGPGIDPLRVGNLFNKFDRGGRKDGLGLGLGLNIVSCAAKLLGAIIRVESVKGEGATFVLECNERRSVEPSV